MRRAVLPLVVVFAMLALVLWPEAEDAPVAAAPESAETAAAPTGRESRRAGVDAPERASVEAPPRPEPSRTRTDERQRFRFVLPDGAPAASATVEIRVGGSGTTLLADSNGVLDVARESLAAGWSLVATHEERATSGVVEARSFPGGPRPEQQVPMAPLARVLGRALYADGAPVAGARISARPEGRRLGAGTPEAVEDVIAGADGRFACTLAGTGGAYRFEAVASDGTMCATTARIGAEANDEVLVQCASTARLVGVVLEPDGAPAAAATVHVLPYDEDGVPVAGAERPRATTDADGRFAFEMGAPVGAWIVAEREGFCASTPRRIEDEAPRVLSLRLVEPTTIAGTVVWEDGRPAAGATVAAIRDADLRPELDRLRRNDLLLEYGFAQAETDANGAFELSPIRPGAAPYQVMCVPDPDQRDRSVETRDVAPGTGDLRIVLSEALLTGGVLEARVTLGATGEPLTTGTLLLWERTEDGAWAQFGMRSFEHEEGLARREGFEPGATYCAAILPRAGHLTGLVDPWTAELGVHAVEIVLPVPARVTASAPTLADGRRAGRVEVHAVDSHPYEAEGWVEAPDPDGRAEFHLRAGEYEARSFDGDHLVSTDAFRVPEGAEAIDVALGTD